MNNIIIIIIIFFIMNQWKFFYISCQINLLLTILIWNKLKNFKQINFEDLYVMIFYF